MKPIPQVKAVHLALALGGVVAAAQAAPAVTLPAGYSLFTSADGKMQFPYPAGWIAMQTPEEFIVASSLDALTLTPQDNFTEFSKGDAAAGISVMNAGAFGLKSAPSTAEVSAALSRMMTAPDAADKMNTLGMKVHAAAPRVEGGKTFSGVSFDGDKLNGFYLAYPYQPGVLLTVIHVSAGAHNAAQEQKLLWAAAQARYTGGVPALPKGENK